MRTKFRTAVRQPLKKLLFATPTHLAANHIQIDGKAKHQLEESIKENCHAHWPASVSQEVHDNDLKEHVHERLDKDRRIFIPWLDNIKSLNNKNILEVGCGTGSSSVALAEQGARVTGIDVAKGGLAVARDRVMLYGLSVKLKEMNATEILGAFGPNSFDVVVFFASLEHMTISERLTALESAWEVLSVGGLLVIIETPNRLWYFDGHTSRLPFFHWLPDELAFHYSRFSARENFCEVYRELTDSSELRFLRQGRGVSFHELEVAIRPLQELQIASSLSFFHGLRHKLTRSRSQRRYKSLLASMHPNIHDAFFDEYLNVALEKV
jgi:S-adenosylmethionine-dependent methyltransferase